MSDDGYPFYCFSEGNYSLDKNDLIADEFGNMFVRFNKDVMVYLGRIGEYKSMLAIIG